MYTLEVTLLDFYTMLPMLILAVGGMALMLIDLALKPQHKALRRLAGGAGLCGGGRSVVGVARSAGHRPSPACWWSIRTRRCWGWWRSARAC